MAIPHFMRRRVWISFFYADLCVAGIQSVFFVKVCNVSIQGRWQGDDVYIYLLGGY